MVGTGLRFASAAPSIRLVSGASLLVVGTGLRFASAAPSIRLVAGASLDGRGSVSFGTEHTGLRLGWSDGLRASLGRFSPCAVHWLAGSKPRA
jgi:hypothetical protein